jgi:hypothetical protein
MWKHYEVGVRSGPVERATWELMIVPLHLPLGPGRHPPWWLNA